MAVGVGELELQLSCGSIDDADAVIGPRRENNVARVVYIDGVDVGPLPPAFGRMDGIADRVEQLPCVDATDLVPGWVDFYEVVAE